MNSTKGIVLSLFMTLCLGTEAFAQRFFSIVFDQLPKDNQLYARDDNSIAEVPISGIIELAGWKQMSVVTYRNNVRVGYSKSAFDYQGKSSARFEMKPKIKAEMADYSFAVYACKNDTDSSLIVTRTEVVAGDFYVINGQSNAAATIFGDWSSKYCRTVARIPDSVPTITVADTLWIGAAWSWTYVGAWGLELQRSILEKYGIPTCVINGSVPGKKISEFLERDAANPGNPNSLYGFLKYRVNISKATRIRAFFWMHGEQEVFEKITRSYSGDYDQLFKFWQQDYPMVDQFVVIQTNVILLKNDDPNPLAGSIRDFLRRTKFLYPKTDHFTQISAPGYDGAHYNRPGYEEIGRRVFRLIAPTVYKSDDTDNVRSPDIKRAFYTSAKKDEVTLTFDEGQVMKWSADTTIKGQDGTPLVMSLKNLFYLDGVENKMQVASGKTDGNKVILTLKEPSAATRINYLPSFYPANLPLFAADIAQFTGPYLVNKRGVGAFSFKDVTLADALAATTLTTARSGFNTVNLSWKAVDGATGYILERKSDKSAAYVSVKTLDSKTLSFEDKDVQISVIYTYRMKVISDKSESPYAESTIDLSPVLAVEPDPKDAFWQVYPNPVSNLLKIDFQKPVSGELRIIDIKGKDYLSSKLKSRKNVEVNIATWPAGTYLLNVKNETGLMVTQKIIKQ